MSRTDTAYQASLRKARAEVVRMVVAEFGDSLDVEDIAGSFTRFAEQAAPLIEGGQSTAQTISAAYLDALGGRTIEIATDIAGTTRAGKTLEEGMAPFGPMMLGNIGNGATREEAAAFGESLVSGYTDREVTAAADRETERQVSAIPGSWQWEGIVQPDACDACQANSGVHDADEEFYRHNDCNCDRRWIPTAGVTDDEEQLAFDLPLDDTEREVVVSYPGAPDVGIPPDPDYLGEGYGLKVGADERTAQVEELLKSGSWPEGREPWEVSAIRGDMDKAVEGIQFGWLDGPATPESALLQTVMRDADGMVWTKGLPALEPTAAARTAAEAMYDKTQASLANGPDVFTVYRGLKSDVTTRNVLESWSTDRGFAERFDGHAILQATVPRRAIYMDLRTETLYESELVIRGELVPTSSIKVLPGTGTISTLGGGLP